MLPFLLKAKSLFGGFPLLTVIKIGVILSLMGATSWITWNIAQRDIEKERLEIAIQQLKLEKSNTAFWMQELNKSSELASKALDSNKKLDVKVSSILKEHNNAPTLPSDCVIDNAGVLSLSKARDAAITNANSSNTAKPSN